MDRVILAMQRHTRSETTAWQNATQSNITGILTQNTSLEVKQIIGKAFSKMILVEQPNGRQRDPEKMRWATRFGSALLFASLLRRPVSL